jgi:hypothetical protein
MPDDPTEFVDGMPVLAAGVVDLAKEHKVDLAEFAIALTQAGTIAKQVAKIRQGG